MKNIIFDLDLTLVDTSCLEIYRKTRNWSEVFRRIPETSLYPGIRETFAEIKEKGIRTAVVSTAPSNYVRAVLDHHNLPVDAIIGYHDAKPIKPHPAPMRRALELLDAKAYDTISFGDRAIDIAASNAAGIKSVACLWGTKEKHQLLASDYDYAIMKPVEMIDLIG